MYYKYYVLYFTASSSPPRRTGSMSYPVYGAVLLALAAIMCFSMDNWLGVGYFSLVLFGRSYDWEAAYGPLLKKIFRSSGGGNTAGGSSSAVVASNSVGSNRDSSSGGVERSNDSGKRDTDSLLDSTSGANRSPVKGGSNNISYLESQSKHG